MTSRYLHSSSVSLNQPRRLDRDARGAVFVEYLMLVGFVAFVMALMLASLGPSVVREYSARRGTLYDHSP